ncbi:MAG: heme exporter protein CcmD [Methylobacterium sp.]|jgi:heme exporter protein CcmD|nr:heme exporter protein CcmD [Methylobacterium sp.]MCA3603081.1 heme exporter protein CcmD [Methylobacterium sp.]MCA3613316.1 heme exporter protein CcmD [Methylobacterium sp.]MCA3614555.1 heme exporter protein CcmD [Methylobacterium sp.]MCA4910463.1 heme exporter protein CcmD [Methylobacterium sp.]
MSGQYFGFIASAYAAAILVLGAMIGGAVLRYRSARTRLARAEGLRESEKARR